MSSHVLGIKDIGADRMDEETALLKTYHCEHNRQVKEEVKMIAQRVK